MIPDFSLVKSPKPPDSLLMRVQDNIKAVFDKMRSDVRNQFRVISGVRLNGSANTVIQHKLGRVPVGWLITDLSDPASALGVIYRVEWDDRTIILYAPVACTAQIEVW